MVWQFKLDKTPDKYKGRQTLYSELKLGGDPELFLTNPDGLIVAPESIGVKPTGPYLYPDGAQLELHPEPSHCRGYMLDNLRTCLRQAKLAADKRELHLNISPAVPVTTRNLQEFPKSALIAGCEPDFDAYTGETNLRWCDFRKHRTRYGGGHLHAGHPVLQNNPNLPSIVAMCDLVVGIFDTALTPVPKLERVRRRFYGRAGCFRPQPHGFEYRTLSNSWLRHPRMAFTIYGLFRDAIDLCVLRPNSARELWGRTSQDVAHIINEGDKEAARRLWVKVVEPFMVEQNVRLSGCVSEVFRGYLDLATEHAVDFPSPPEPSPDWKIEKNEDSFETHGNFVGSLREVKYETGR